MKRGEIRFEGAVTEDLLSELRRFVTAVRAGEGTDNLFICISQFATDMDSQETFRAYVDKHENLSSAIEVGIGGERIFFALPDPGKYMGRQKVFWLRSLDELTIFASDRNSYIEEFGGAQGTLLEFASPLSRS